MVSSGLSGDIVAHLAPRFFDDLRCAKLAIAGGCACLLWKIDGQPNAHSKVMPWVDQAQAPAMNAAQPGVTPEPPHTPRGSPSRLVRTLLWWTGFVVAALFEAVVLTLASPGESSGQQFLQTWWSVALVSILPAILVSRLIPVYEWSPLKAMVVAAGSVGLVFGGIAYLLTLAISTGASILIVAVPAVSGLICGAIFWFFARHCVELLAERR